MSRKLYLDDKQVAAGQDALAPLRATAGPDLARFIDAVAALRRNSPKDWRYRTVDETGRQWFGHSRYIDNASDTAEISAALGRPGSSYWWQYARSQAEAKNRANVIAHALGIGVVIERRADDNSPWELFYRARPEKYTP